MNSLLLSRKLCVIELLPYVREERSEGEVIMTGAASREEGGKLIVVKGEKEYSTDNEYGGNR